ncbi:MAG: hypothetical protein E7625_03170 [Ruminococcaceae bacterium]|nr:hypothetical protein [Oscillospiraceae bacterium]
MQEQSLAKQNSLALFAFLAVELVLYALILTTGGNLLVAVSYISIVLCFLYALFHLKNAHRLMVAALGFTVVSDYFLVVCQPPRQLPAMIFFLIVQLLYALHLQRKPRRRPILVLRIALTLAIEIIALIVLKENTDALALVSVAYYANLAVNLLASCLPTGRDPRLPIAFLLFLLCDTVIGLQVASGGYLAIPEHSLLYRMLFMDFQLSWFFYLPSQVLLTLSAAHPVKPPVETTKSDGA